MSQIRQQARQAVREVAERRRQDRAQRERWLMDLAVQVVTALRERDAAVADAELRAGKALREMTEADEVTLTEAVAWCGGEINVREATRLRRLTDLAADASDSAASTGTMVGESGGMGGNTAAG